MSPLTLTLKNNDGWPTASNPFGTWNITCYTCIQTKPMNPHIQLIRKKSNLHISYTTAIPQTSIRVGRPIPPTIAEQFAKIRMSQNKIPRTQTGLEANEGLQIIDGRQRPINTSLAKGMWQTCQAITSGIHPLDWNLWHAFEHERSGYQLY